MFNQGLAQPTSDNNLTVHAHMSANIQLLVRLMYFLCKFWLISQSRMSKTLCFLRRYFIRLKWSANTPSERVKYLVLATNEKRGCLHLPVRRSGPSTASAKTDRETSTHGVYRYTVKCAYEDTSILAAHYGV